MVLLQNEAFLAELTKMFQKSRASGSVTLVMKRYDGRTKPKPSSKKDAKKPTPVPSEYKCLMRATLRKKTISTLIGPKDVNKYQQAYNDLLKANITSLRKYKKGKSKAKATQ